MDERERLVREFLRGRLAMVELARAYGVAPKTAYKWVARFEREGLEGLKERSRARHSQAATSAEVRQAILDFRRAHPTWGPKKIVHRLGELRPKLLMPAPSTVGDLLRSHGLSVPQRRKTYSPPYTQPLAHAAAPNDVWCADYKGDFAMGDGTRCYPLTITDAASRALLACRACPGTKGPPAKAVFEAVFRKYGLPRAIRTDNGSPFAGLGAGGLTTLSVWWLKLGIRHERIEPGHPEQNGRHERMHRTLKAETTRPPASCVYWQQKKFDAFQEEFNNERPHEALDFKRPVELYRFSARPFVEEVEHPSYPGHFDVRWVSAAGRIQVKGRSIFLTQTLVHEPVGLEEVDDGCWRVWFGSLQLGLLDEEGGRLRHLGRGPIPRPST